MNGNRTCLAPTLFAALAGLILLTSMAYAQGNSAPVAVDDLISKDPNAFVGLGGDFYVFGTSRAYAAPQRNSPSVAALEGGEFVIAWTGAGFQAGNGLIVPHPPAIEFSLFDSADARTPTQSSRFRNYQVNPSVAALEGGGFVVAWTDQNNTDIRAQRYDSAGFAEGDEINVNSTITNSQSFPSVAALVGGGFVIAWTDASETGGDTSGNAIRAQRFSDTGIVEGSEFLVNTTTMYSQSFPRVAALEDGGFVVTWADASETGGGTYGNAIRAQRYDAAGVAAGVELLVNTTLSSIRFSPSVAALEGGGFVIAWTDTSETGGDTSGNAIRAQLYDNTGVATGVEFLVNTTTSNSQEFPAIAAFEGGGFVIAWGGYSPPSGSGIFAQRYDAAGVAAGVEFLVNSTYSNSQEFPSIVVLEGDRFLVAWKIRDVPNVEVEYHIRARSFTRPALISNAVYLFDVLANDSDPNGDALTVTHIDAWAIAEGETVLLSSGTSTTLRGGELEYDARAAPFAIALPEGVTGDDSFTYTISDGALTDTANVTVTLTGVNDPPAAIADTLSVGEDDGAADVAAILLANDTDPDTSETALLAISGIGTSGTQGQVAFNAGTVTYSPNGAFESLALGQTGSDAFSYTITDPGGLTDTAAVAVTINGANDAPTASADALTFAEEEGARDVTATLLANDTDPDSGETAQLAVTAVDTTLTLGRVTLTGNVVSYDPNGVFNALAQGQTATDRFDYTISDSHGSTATATATVTINGFNGYVLSVNRTGLGAGIITSSPIGLNCGGGGACEAFFTQSSQVSLSRFVAPESRFVGWGGDCESAGTGACTVAMTANRAVSARFELEDPPAGRIVAATLPGARSGYVGGGDITVFMTVLSRATTPAQACRITAPNDPPFTLSYRQVNAQNEVIGDANPLFDLGNGGAINFVIALTPTRTTDQSGYVFLPRIQCENADLAPIEGVNSVLVSIGAAPVPDILSIGSTPSADGVVRIPATGNRISFMSAAAVNIGAGDGSAGAGEATVTASVDTGAASLPVTLEVCETASTGGCITPRGVTQVSTVFAQNVAKFFAVFVRANGEATVPFDPANARVFLSFADANGTIRSATSAAISAPAPASDQPEVASLTGRWSVLVRQESGEWPSLARGSLHVLGDGRAVLASGDTARLVDIRATQGANGSMVFTLNDAAGMAGRDGTIRLGDALLDQSGAFWGVRDARLDAAPDWTALTGQFGEGVILTEAGEFRGSIAGCSVYGITGEGYSEILTLSGCDQAGTYTALLDPPANDNDAAALIIASERRGWRMAR